MSGRSETARAAEPMPATTLAIPAMTVPALESRWRAVRRATGAFGWTVMLIPLQAGLLLLAQRRAAAGLARFYSAGLCRLLGVQVSVSGAPVAPHALFVANHCSYLDVPVLASTVRAGFVARHDIAGWPGVNLLAALGRTVYAERRSVRSAGVRDAMRARLDAGDSLVMFPEGTTNNGVRMLPFRSALFASVDDAGAGSGGVPVQPAVIVYRRLGGLPMPRWLAPVVAWYGDMALAPHLWGVLKLAPLHVEVIFLPAVSAADFPDRKALARHCEESIATGLAAARREPHP